MKPVSRVEVSNGVFCNCIAHALTTEKEEIMGLLLGDTVTDESGEIVTYIWKVVPQIRKDRRKDRVECSSTQMAEVAQLAEEETRNSHRTTRVVGWYHSHPHITALPSHVDVQTQASYQALDEGFVGIIVSCFNSLQAPEQGDRIQVIAFQSMQRVVPDLGASDDDAEEDSQMRAALRQSRQEAARTEGPAWEHSLVPVSLVADGDAARDAALHDVVARINSLKQEEWTPYAEEMAALDAQLPPPAEAFARTLYCTGVLQQSMSDLLQGSILPTLTALHARAFTLSQRRRAALDKLMLYQEAVNSKQVEPTPKLDGIVNQQIEYHLQLNDASVAQEHSTHSVGAGPVPVPHRQQPQHAQQPQQPAQQQQPGPPHPPQQQQQRPPQQQQQLARQAQHAQQQLQQPVMSQPQQQQMPRHAQLPQHAQQLPRPQLPQQQQHAWSAGAAHGHFARQSSQSELQNGEVARGAPGGGHGGERAMPGLSGEAPGSNMGPMAGPTGAPLYNTWPQPAAAQRHSNEAGSRAGVADMHSAAYTPYHQPQLQHQLSLQQHAVQQHALQHAQQAQRVPQLQMQQLQIQAAATAAAAARAQPQQMAQHDPRHEHDAAQRGARGAREAVYPQGHPVQHTHQHPAMLAVQPTGQQAVPQSHWPAGQPPAARMPGGGVAHLLPGQAPDAPQERPAAAADTSTAGDRHRWNGSAPDAAVCSDFLTRTGNSPTPPALAADTTADAGGRGGASAVANTAPSRRSTEVRRPPGPSRAEPEASVAAPPPPQPPARPAAQRQGSAGARRGGDESHMARGATEEERPQNGVHAGPAAEPPSAPAGPAVPAAPAGPGARSSAWGRQAPAAQATAAAAGRSEVRQAPPPPVQKPPQQAAGGADVQPASDSPVEAASGAVAKVGPSVAGAWGSGNATFASKLKGEGGTTGIGAAPQRTAQPTAGPAGQAGGLTTTRGDASAAAGQGSREGEQRGGQKGTRGEGRAYGKQNSRGGRSRGGRSGNLGDGPGAQGGSGGRRGGGNGNRQGGRGGGGGGGNGDGGDGAERSGRKN